MKNHVAKAMLLAMLACVPLCTYAQEKNDLIQEQTDTVWTVKIPGTSFDDVEYSPDGKYIAAASGYLYILSPNDGSIIRILKQIPGEPPQISQALRKIAFVGSNVLAAAVQQDFKRYFIQFWNVETGEALWQLPTPTIAPAMAASTDGRYFATGDGVENFWVWQIKQDGPQLLWQDTEPGAAGMGVWFSPDGNYILYSKGGSMKLRRTGDSTLVHQWSHAFGACVATPDASLCIANIGPIGLGVFDTLHEQPIDTLRSGYGDHNPGFAAVRITAGGKYLVTSGEQKIKIWDMDSRSVLREYPGAEGISISPDSAFIVTAGAGAGVVRLYRFNTTTTDVQQQQQEASALRVLPNPTETNPMMLFSLHSTQRVEIDLIDATGQVVYALPEQILQAGEHTIPLAVEQLPSGIYFCRLRNGKTVQTAQFLIAR